MASNGFVFTTLLLLAALHAGSAIKCFRCGEDMGGDGICRDEHRVKHASVDCADSCIKHTFATISFIGIETIEIIMRTCADPSYCDKGIALLEKKTGIKTQACTVCTSDHCNSSHTAIPSFILVATLAVKHFL